MGTRIRSLGRFVAKALIVGLAFTLSLFGPVSVRVVEAQGVSNVTGTVRDSNNDPVPGVRVGIYALQTPFVTTNASGNYTIANVPHASGPYDVQLLAPCRKEQSKRVVVDGPEVVNFTISAGNDVAAGYVCSLSTLPYISGTSDLGLAGDNESVELSTAFGFSFFGTTYINMHVSTNGYVNFLSANSVFNNDPVPSSGGPNAAIYAFWDDLVVDASADVRFASGGVSPNRFIVFEWLNVTFANDPFKRVSFEMVLFESGGRIVLNYKDISPLASDLRERGAGATVGIENQAGTAGLQRLFNQPYLDDGYAIELAPAPK